MFRFAKWEKWGKVEKRSKRYQINKDETFIQKLGSFSWGALAASFSWGRFCLLLGIKSLCWRSGHGAVASCSGPDCCIALEELPARLSLHTHPRIFRPTAYHGCHFSSCRYIFDKALVWQELGEIGCFKVFDEKRASEVLVRSRGRTDVIVACLFFQSFFFKLEILSVVCCELLVGPFEYDESWLQNQFKVSGLLVLPRACVRSPGNPLDADFLRDACRRVSTSCKQ